MRRMNRVRGWRDRRRIDTAAVVACTCPSSPPSPSAGIGTWRQGVVSHARRVANLAWRQRLLLGPRGMEAGPDRAPLELAVPLCIAITVGSVWCTRLCMSALTLNSPSSHARSLERAVSRICPVIWGSFIFASIEMAVPSPSPISAAAQRAPSVQGRDGGLSALVPILPGRRVSVVHWRVENLIRCSEVERRTVSQHVTLTDCFQAGRHCGKADEEASAGLVSSSGGFGWCLAWAWAQRL